MWTPWTLLDIMDEIGQNGRNCKKKIDVIGQDGRNWTKWTKLDIMDEMIHYDLCTKLDKMDIFGREEIVDDEKMKWKKISNFKPLG